MIAYDKSHATVQATYHQAMKSISGERSDSRISGAVESGMAFSSGSAHSR